MQAKTLFSAMWRVSLNDDERVICAKALRCSLEYYPHDFRFIDALMSLIVSPCRMTSMDGDKITSSLCYWAVQEGQDENGECAAIVRKILSVFQPEQEPDMAAAFQKARDWLARVTLTTEEA